MGVGKGTQRRRGGKEVESKCGKKDKNCNTTTSKSVPYNSSTSFLIALRYFAGEIYWNVTVMSYREQRWFAFPGGENSLLQVYRIINDIRH